MAAILVKLLSGSLMPADIIKWLTKLNSKDELPEDLKELYNLKSEFVPFYINYLRDQTFNLLQTGHSSSNTPAKTPLSSKFKKQFSKHKNNGNQVPSRGKAKGQLFETTEDGVFLKSAPKKHHTTRHGHGGSEHTPRSQRSIHFHTPDSVQRSKNKHSFGEFISPEVDWKKKSPHSTNKKDDTFSPMQFSGRKSGGRKSVEKKAITVATVPAAVTPPPSFSLESEDFPSLAAGPSVSNTTSTPKLGSLPDGVRVITASRRITTTVIKQGKSAKKHALKDVKESTQRPDSPGAGSKAALFASPSAGSGWNTSMPFSSSQALTFEKTPHKNNSLEDERQLLRALRSGSVQSPADVPSPISRVPLPPPIASVVRTADLDSGQTIGNITIAENKPLITASSDVRGTCVGVAGGKASDTGDKLTSTPGKSIVLSAVSATTPVKQCLSDGFPTKTPTKDPQEVALEVSPANPSQITYRQQLDLLAQLYSSFIDENLVPNLMVELYFIIQLLTVRGGDVEEPQIRDLSQDLDEVEYLNTVHNAVYFAVTMLSKQTRVLEFLDKGTLRLLVDNQRVMDFQPVLKDTLSRMYDTCPAKLFPMSMCSPIGGVSFQAETDNRNNFPSDQSFHAFRKQRDLFYELVRLWQENHMTNGWSLSETQGARILNLVTERTEMATHVHFCRLFQSQLLHMCKADHSHVKESDDNNVSLLVTLRKTNPDKFKRLQERFITPVSTKGPCPLPSFPGCQEFFRDFVLCAKSPHFYQHLANTLTTKIREVNQTEFHLAESLEDTSEVEERERLSGCLVTVRLLGKFLGLTHFLPYQCSEHLPAHVTNTCVNVRNQVSPALDVLHYLHSAQESGRLVLTVPWIVEYLSMMDVVTPHIEYYQQVLMYLMQIHREATVHFNKKWSHSMMLVILYLGWLFELPVFPEGLFFRDVGTGTRPPSEDTLDSLGLVDQKILYTCCPYLGDLRMLLVEFVVGSGSRNNHNNVRKITPISTESTVTAPLSEKQLQHQLEDNFFHNHPASMKRTVDFVADRVASNHIKRFRAQVLPSVLQKIYKEAKILAMQMSGASPNTRSQKKSEDVIIQKSMYLCAEIRKSDKLQAAQYCAEKVCEILHQLLPEEVSPSVLAMCANISRRLAMEKVNTWMSTHITTAMMKREMCGDYEKQMRHLLKSTDSAPQKPLPQQHLDNQPSPGHQASHSATGQGTSADTHCGDVLGPADMLIKLKNTVCDLIVVKRGGETLQELLQTVHAFPDLFKHRQDLLPNVTKSMGRLLVDAIYFLICEEPEFWKKEAESCLLSVIENYFSGESLFDHVISVPVVYSVQNAADAKRCWQLYSSLLHSLLQKHLVTVDSLSAAATHCIGHTPLSHLVDLIPVLTSLIITHHLHATHSSEDFFPLIDTMLQVVQEDTDLINCVEGAMMQIQDHHDKLDKHDRSDEFLVGQQSHSGDLRRKSHGSCTESRKNETSETTAQSICQCSTSYAGENEIQPVCQNCIQTEQLHVASVNGEMKGPLYKEKSSILSSSKFGQDENLPVILEYEKAPCKVVVTASSDVILGNEQVPCSPVVTAKPGVNHLNKKKPALSLLCDRFVDKQIINNIEIDTNKENMSVQAKNG